MRWKWRETMTYTLCSRANGHPTTILHFHRRTRGGRPQGYKTPPAAIPARTRSYHHTTGEAKPLNSFPFLLIPWSQPAAVLSPLPTPPPSGPLNSTYRRAVNDSLPSHSRQRDSSFHNTLWHDLVPKSAPLAPVHPRLLLPPLPLTGDVSFHGGRPVTGSIHGMGRRFTAFAAISMTVQPRLQMSTRQS